MSLSINAQSHVKQRKQTHRRPQKLPQTLNDVILEIAEIPIDATLSAIQQEEARKVTADLKKSK